MTATNHKPRVLVLYGGQSPEHAVSCVTASGVLRSLDAERYDTIPVGITKEGRWTLPAEDPRGFSFVQGALPEVLPGEESFQLVRRDSGAELLALDGSGSGRSLGPIDVVFPLLHGPFGEDGTLQGFLELVGVPYVGAGVLASAMGMDKHYMKVAFAAAGLQVGSYRTLTAQEWQGDRSACRETLKNLKLPLFVKPARGGSSVGITRVNVWDELDNAIETAMSFDPKVVVEEGIDGREIECGVLGGRSGDTPRASQCGEIVVRSGDSSHQFYDFTSKYTDGSSTELTCPAEIPESVSNEIRRQAIVAFRALGAEGLSRCDFFYTSQGEVVINEVNTMPGFTPVSMYPKMWEVSGIEYAELIRELIELALERPVGLR